MRGCEGEGGRRSERAADALGSGRRRKPNCRRRVDALKSHDTGPRHAAVIAMRLLMLLHVKRGRRKMGILLLGEVVPIMMRLVVIGQQVR